MKTASCLALSAVLALASPAFAIVNPGKVAPPPLLPDCSDITYEYHELKQMALSELSYYYVGDEGIPWDLQLKTMEPDEIVEVLKEKHLFNLAFMVREKIRAMRNRNIHGCPIP